MQKFEKTCECGKVIIGTIYRMVAGIDARTLERYKRSLAQFKFIKTTETGFEIIKFADAKQNKLK